jgi:hypothetical protein
MIEQRYLTEAVAEDLRKKMVFIGGARQVGKTTFAVDLLAKRFQSPAYFLSPAGHQGGDRRSSRANEESVVIPKCLVEAMRLLRHCVPRNDAWTAATRAAGLPASVVRTAMRNIS